jgi:putative glutamine amidotransferase
LPIVKPLLGITTELKPDSGDGRCWLQATLLAPYAEGIASAGGLPVALPPAQEGTAREVLARLDGLVLSGGLDIPAEALGEAPHPRLQPMLPERWASERLWLEAALELGKPVLGICLGMQVINTVAGGKMIQDVPSQWPGAIVHTDGSGTFRHEVTLVEGTTLARLAPARQVTVTSSHHQAIAGAAPGYRASALSPDGIIEAIERTEGSLVLGVQWHPERGPYSPDWVLEGFVRECGKNRSSMNDE